MTLSLSLSLSLTHTHTHTRTHAYTRLLDACSCKQTHSKTPSIHLFFLFIHFLSLPLISPFFSLYISLVCLLAYTKKPCPPSSFNTKQRKNSCVCGALGLFLSLGEQPPVGEAGHVQSPLFFPLNLALHVLPFSNMGSSPL